MQGMELSEFFCVHLNFCEPLSASVEKVLQSLSFLRSSLLTLPHLQLHLLQFNPG